MNIQFKAENAVLREGMKKVDKQQKHIEKNEKTL